MGKSVRRPGFWQDLCLAKSANHHGKGVGGVGQGVEGTGGESEEGCQGSAEGECS